MLALNQAFFLLLQITIIKVHVCLVNVILFTSDEINQKFYAKATWKCEETH